MIEFNTQKDLDDNVGHLYMFIGINSKSKCRLIKINNRYYLKDIKFAEYNNIFNIEVDVGYINNWFIKYDYKKEWDLEPNPIFL